MSLSCSTTSPLTVCRFGMIWSQCAISPLCTLPHDGLRLSLPCKNHTLHRPTDDSLCLGVMRAQLAFYMRRTDAVVQRSRPVERASAGEELTSFNSKASSALVQDVPITPCCSLRVWGFSAGSFVGLAILHLWLDQGQWVRLPSHRHLWPNFRRAPTCSNLPFRARQAVLLLT